MEISGMHTEYVTLINASSRLCVFSTLKRNYNRSITAKTGHNLDTLN